MKFLTKMLYSLEYINEHSPYTVENTENNSVRFFTDSSIEYLAGFIEENNMDIDNVYQFFITQKGKNKIAGVDEKIGKTIAAILKSFFRNLQNILMYVCDTNNKQQAARDRKFRIWFAKYATDDLAFIPKRLDIDEDSYFTAMILSTKASGFDEKVACFNQYFEDLKAKLDE